MSSSSDPSTDQTVDDPELIVTNQHPRHTGVSSTIGALLPLQVRRLRTWLVGEPIAGLAARGMVQAIVVSRRPPVGRPARIWHVRRNREMAIALLVRDLLRLPVRIVFTSAACRFHSPVPRWMIRQTDAVIATTADAAKFVPNVAAVIPHGVDTAHFHPPVDKAAEWRQSGLPGRYGIGMFGRVRPEKGTDLFVDAVCRLLPDFPEFTAIIAGRSTPAHAAFRDRLAQRIDAAGLTRQILWLGEISPAEVAAWYRRCLICVAPARYEGFGLSVLEATASGCAIVASRTGGFADMVGDGETGLILTETDVRTLVGALRTLMSDPAAAEAMGRAGRRRVEQHHSLEREVEAINAVYERLWAFVATPVAPAKSFR